MAGSIVTENTAGPASTPGGGYAPALTLPQVAADPYITVIGPPETGSARLNLARAFDSLGKTLAPLFAGYLILGRAKGGAAEGAVALTAAERYADAQSVILPYLLAAGVLMLFAIVIARSPPPAIGQSTQRVSAQDRADLSPWRHRNLVFGIPAIFIHLIAEIGVADLFISFVGQLDIAGISHERASRYLALLWGGMLIGRFAGSALMRRIEAGAVLAKRSVAAVAVMLVATFAAGPAATWTIFSLGVPGLGPLTGEGAGLLITAIAGALVVQGWLADRHGLRWSLLPTAACERYVLSYAVWGSRVTRPLPDEQPIA